MVHSDSEQFWSQRGLVITVEDADGGRRTVRVATPFARIGSDPRAEVVLPDADVLPCHLYLHATQDGIYCLGLASSAPSGWLTAKRRIEVGRYRMKAAFDGDGPAPQPHDHDPRANDSAGSPLPRLRLRLTGAKKQAFELNLRRQLTVVGRQSPSTLCIHHPTVSRTHAVLFWDGQLLWAVDLLSANGLRCDGKPFDAGPLDASQRISLGDVRCRYLGARRGVPESNESDKFAEGSPRVEQNLAEDHAQLNEAAMVITRLRADLAEAVQAREAAEKLAADHQLQLTQLRANQALLQNSALDVRRELEATQAARADLQASIDERLAALRESLQPELACVAAARDRAEMRAAQRERELADANQSLSRLQAESNDAAENLARLRDDLAATRADLVASREENIWLHESVEARLAAQQAATAHESPQAAVEPVAVLANAESPSKSPLPPAADKEWVFDDRMIGRLLDFRAKRVTGKRRKLVWGIAACLAALIFGAAAAGRVWSQHRTSADTSANAATSTQEPFIEPGLR